MTRQIFLRLVGMFRGQERSFDYGPHNSARYDVCSGPHPADRSSAKLNCSLPSTAALCMYWAHVMALRRLAAL